MFLEISRNNSGDPGYGTDVQGVDDPLQKRTHTRTHTHERDYNTEEKIERKKVPPKSVSAEQPHTRGGGEGIRTGRWR